MEDNNEESHMATEERMNRFNMPGAAPAVPTQNHPSLLQQLQALPVWQRILSLADSHRRLLLIVFSVAIATELVWGLYALTHTVKQPPAHSSVTSPVYPSPKANLASLSIATNTSEATIGKPVTATVTLDTKGIKTDGATAVISYDPKMVTITNVTVGKLYTNYTKPKIDSKLGRITITGITDLKTFYEGKGTFATFTAVPKAKGVTTLSFNVLQASTSASAVAANKQNILTDTNSVQIEIK